MKRKLPKSIKKYIRKEKARIRREVLSLKEQEKQIQGLYDKFIKKNKVETRSLPALEKRKIKLAEKPVF